MQNSENPICPGRKRPRIRLDPADYNLLPKRVLERDGWRCQECGSMKNLHVHHIKPRSKLGGDVMHNLITLCGSCHPRFHGHRLAGTSIDGAAERLKAAVLKNEIAGLLSGRKIN